VAVDVLDAADRANRAAYRAFAERSGGHVEERDGLTLVVGAHPSPIIINTAWRSDAGVAAAGIPEAVTRFYAKIGHVGSVMTAQHLDADIEAILPTLGWRSIRLPGMVAPRRIPDEASPEGTRLRWVGSAADLVDFRHVVQAGFADSDEEREVVETVFSKPESLGATSAGAVVSVDGVDAAAAMVLVLDRAAVVGWVATIPDYRRRGLGAFVTRAVTNQGFDLGAAFATLQASRMGHGVYERLGYRDVAMYRVWLPPSWSPRGPDAASSH
jgi:GNAT superfamily N-acetyltransferase